MGNRVMCPVCAYETTRYDPTTSLTCPHCGIGVKARIKQAFESQPFAFTSEGPVLIAKTEAAEGIQQDMAALGVTDEESVLDSAGGDR